MVQYSLDSLDSVYGAIAHSVRRQLLQRLSEGDATIGELAAPFSMTFTGVSKHIRVLEAAGLVHRTVDGREHKLSLEPAPLRPASRWLENYRSFWERRLDKLDASIRAQRNR